MPKRVVITGLDPDFNHACAKEPDIGTEGQLMRFKARTWDDKIIPGKSTIRFKPEALGYESRESGDRITLYIKDGLFKIVG